MTIYWPDNIPLGIKYGAETEVSKGAKISTDMDYGNKKRRRRFTNTPYYQTITFKLNDEQYDQFMYFYKFVLMDGVCSFYAKVIVGSTVELRRCTIDDDTIKPVHDDWNHHIISFTLEIYKLIAPSTDDGAAWLIGTYGEDFVINTLCDPLQKIVNRDYPRIMGTIA